MSYTNGLDKPTDYFNTKLYTGNGSSSHAITGVGFQPDWVWIKRRNDVDSHFIYDSVRFDGSNAYWLQTNNTNAEGSDRPLTAFGSDGFTIGSNNSGLNANSSTYVSWNWLASNTTASNTDGSITSTVSANTTSGFSIVSYTGNGTAGATIGHGLSSQLDVIFIKNRTNAEAWQTYHRPLGATHHLVLNGNDTAQDNDSRFNDVHPTSSVFTLGNNDTVNKNTSNFVAYCFHSVKGFSKMGSYTGNGNADGTFVYTGFKPAFTIIKRTDTANDWMVGDNKINPFNVTDNMLRANLNNVQQSGNYVDYLSNGFKPRLSGNAFNGSGGTYIYMAFAENPFVTSTGISTTAR